MNVQCFPTDWHNQIDSVIVIGGALPLSQVDVAPGREQWLCDLAPRRLVERAPRRSPAGHPEHTAAGRDSDPARGRRHYSLHYADKRSAMDGRRMLMFYSHDEKSYVG